jgi:hypothetical protein
VCELKLCFIFIMLSASSTASPRARSVRVLAIFCNPKGTDALRLQSEQRVLQQSLRSSSSATLEVAPAATVDDLRAALLGKCFDVIHFSGHGCVDGPLQAMLRHKAAGEPLWQECAALAIGALKTWLQGATDLSTSSTSSLSKLCTLEARRAAEGRPIAVWVQDGAATAVATATATTTADGSSSGGSSSDCSNGGGSGTATAREADVRMEIDAADLLRHRVGALAFEGANGALEPPKPDVLARLLAMGLEPLNGVVFLNACDTHIQARHLREHGVKHVVYAGSRISDQSASEFSRGFYEAIACGCDTTHAYEQGRLAVELRYDTARHGCPSLLAAPLLAASPLPSGHAHGGQANGLASSALAPAPSSSSSASPSPSLNAQLATALSGGEGRGGGEAGPRQQQPQQQPSSSSSSGGGAMGGGGGRGGGGGPGSVHSRPPSWSQPDAGVNPMLEEFSGRLIQGSAPPLQELVPMHGSHQLAVCDTLPRFVRDGLGRLHSLGSCRSNMPRLESALAIGMLSRKPPTVEAFRHAHGLLGAAQKLRWGVLQHLADGKLDQARAQLVHALRLIRAVSEAQQAAGVTSEQHQQHQHGEEVPPLVSADPVGGAKDEGGGGGGGGGGVAAGGGAAAGGGGGGGGAGASAVDDHRSGSIGCTSSASTVSSAGVGGDGSGGEENTRSITHVYPELQIALGDADTSLSLAVVQLHLHDVSRANEHAKLALEGYTAFSAPTHAAFAQLMLAECAQLREEHATAEELLRGALRTFRANECVLGEAEALRLLGGLRVAVGDEIAGPPLLRDAVERYETLEQDGASSPFGMSACLEMLLGNCNSSSGGGLTNGNPGQATGSDGSDAMIASRSRLLEEGGADAAAPGGVGRRRRVPWKNKKRPTSASTSTSTSASASASASGLSREGLPTAAAQMEAARSDGDACVHPPKTRRPPAGGCLIRCSCFRMKFVLAASGDEQGVDADADEVEHA